MEVMLENDCSQIFLLSIKLMLTNERLECLDLNPLDKEGEIAGSILKRKEKRSYVYILSPKNNDYEINKKEKIDIGQIEIRWQNIFGDFGTTNIGPFLYIEDDAVETKPKADMEIHKLPPEVPSWIKLYMLNCTNKTMKVELDVESERKETDSLYGMSK